MQMVAVLQTHTVIKSKAHYSCCSCAAELLQIESRRVIVEGSMYRMGVTRFQQHTLTCLVLCSSLS